MDSRLFLKMDILIGLVKSMALVPGLTPLVFDNSVNQRTGAHTCLCESFTWSSGNIHLNVIYFRYEGQFFTTSLKHRK